MGLFTGKLGNDTGCGTHQIDVGDVAVYAFVHHSVTQIGIDNRMEYRAIRAFL